MTLLIVIIVLALIFDYINGFHDAANSIATVVSTKVLTPFQAVIWAAFFNVVAYFIFQDHAVANTISKTVNKEFITLNVILAGLIAAIFWNLLTWWYGIPSSSSHTLIGGFAGAAIAHAMMTKGLTISWSKVVENDTIIKTVLFIFFAPMIGMIISIFINIVTILRNMWLRMGIIILATALTVLLFDRFETNKMNQGLEKFIKLDKYKLEVAKAEETLEKDNNNEKAKEDLVTAEKKLSGAKDIYAKIVPLIVEFDNIGADSIAAFAYHNGLLTDIEVSKLKDEVRNANNFLILESLSADNAEKKKEYDVAKVEFGQCARCLQCHLSH
jgi:phosphate/sulfate permease